MTRWRRLAIIGLVAWACAAPGAELPLASWCDENSDLDQALGTLGYGAEQLPDVDSLLGEGPLIVVVQADPGRLKALHARQAEVQAWLDRGGWLLLDGVDEAGLADFDALVGVAHRLRPFRSERVTLTGATDPVGRQLDPWAVAMRPDPQGWGDVTVSADAYGPVVDTDDWAPFATLPDASWFHHPDSNIDHNPLNLVDGFGSGDSWKRVFAMYPGRTRMEIPFRFADPVRIKRVVVVTSFIYPGITHVGIACDQGAPEILATDGPGVHALTFAPPREVRTVTVTVRDWQENGRGVIGIDDIHLEAQHPPGWSDRVHPLTSVGALVAYPQGGGGILLCQLPFRPPGADADSANVQRRLTLLRQLLENLHAHHGRRISAPRPERGLGSPVPLSALIDAPALTPLAPDRHPWPTGKRVFAGVRFQLPDPPAALMLASGQQATIPIQGAVAGVCLLLHAAADGAAPTPGTLLGHLVIRLADGRTLTEPLQEGDDCATADQGDGPLVARAQRVWQLDTGALRRCLYLRQWNNPTPAVPVSAITLHADAAQVRLWLAGVTRLER